MYKILSKNTSRRILSSTISSKKQDDSDDLKIVPSYIKESEKNGTLVQGLIESKNKGGYKILVRGTFCFCPFSLFPRIDDEEFFNLVKTKVILNFKVTKADDVNNIIVSRVDVARREGIVIAKQIYDNKNYIYGKVRSVKDYGAFIDIEGFIGLLHISKFKSNYLPITGDIVKVIITEIDCDLFKIHLSSLIDEKIYKDEYKKIEIIETNNKKTKDIKVKCQFCNVDVLSKNLKKHIKKVHDKIKNNFLQNTSVTDNDELNKNKLVIYYKNRKYKSLYNKYGV